MPRRFSEPRTRNFTVTTAAGTNADEAEARLEEMFEAVARACRASFDAEQGYRISTDELQGVVRARRCLIRGPRCDAVLSVRLVRPRDRYRTEAQRPLEMRISGHAKLAPAPKIPLFPRGAVTSLLLGVLGVCALAWFGWAGTRGVVGSPSLSAAVDALGLAVTIGALALAAVLLRRLLLWAQQLPWESLGLSPGSWATRDAERWRSAALGIREIARQRSDRSRSQSGAAAPRGVPSWG